MNLSLECDSNTRVLSQTDLQSAPFVHSGIQTINAPSRPIRFQSKAYGELLLSALRLLVLNKCYVVIIAQSGPITLMPALPISRVVRMTGFQPARYYYFALEPKSRVSSSSTTSANYLSFIAISASKSNSKSSILS